MRKTREILRLKELKRSHRQIARATGAGIATVSEAVARAKASQLDWAAITAMILRCHMRIDCQRAIDHHVASS